jgi:hypothetical protein
MNNCIFICINIYLYIYICYIIGKWLTLQLFLLNIELITGFNYKYGFCNIWFIGTLKYLWWLLVSYGKYSWVSPDLISNLLKVNSI